MGTITNLVLRTGAAQFTSWGERLGNSLHETDMVISTGLLVRLRRYALARLAAAGFEVDAWDCEVCTCDGDDRPSDRAYSVKFTNPRGGSLGVEGILTGRGWPCLDHGFFVEDR